ncbi:MAG TPA: DUF255 domain-containing protein [Ferruginibacter sp.]|nr:thioredoxin [Chitinophagaceae bacterium]HRI24990.1 DUF255 domain-containing protein [Ferruginibacter sp.]
MNKVLGILLLFITPVLVSFHGPKKEKINWLSIAELQAAYAKEPKPIIIDVYTDWCGWCKVMDRETYSNDKVADYLNKNFYAVKYNAESTSPVVFANKKYNYNPAYRANELAVFLLGGRMGYPTTVLLSSLDAQPAPLSGYLKPSELEAPVKFFGEGVYKNKNYPDFMKGFTGSW